MAEQLEFWPSSHNGDGSKPRKARSDTHAMLARLSGLTPATSTQTIANLVDGLAERAREEFAVGSEGYQYPLIVFEQQLAMDGVKEAIRKVVLDPWEGTLEDSKAAITETRQRLTADGQSEATMSLVSI